MSKDELLEHLINFLPFMLRKFSECFQIADIPRLQLELLLHIHYNDNKPIKFYCQKMKVSKPNMTPTVNKMISESLIKKITNPSDKREALLSMTPNGKELLLKQKNIIKEEMSKKISTLSEEEIKKLNSLFNEMKNILNKI